MMYPLVRDCAADGIPVAVTCWVLGFSRQAFYKWSTNPVCQRDVDDAYLANAAIDVHRTDRGVGHRLIADELRVDHGVLVSDHRMNRVCRLAGIRSVLAPKKGSGKNQALPFSMILLAVISPPTNPTTSG